MNKIFIVDDEEAMIQLLYSAELTEEGYDVVTSGQVTRLMELITQKRPDLIVQDIELGKYDGLDLLQDIRNTWHNLPIILCTAYTSFKYDLKSIAADYHVVKSSDLRELKPFNQSIYESPRKNNNTEYLLKKIFSVYRLHKRYSIVR